MMFFFNSSNAIPNRDTAIGRYENQLAIPLARAQRSSRIAENDCAESVMQLNALSNSPKIRIFYASRFS